MKNLLLFASIIAVSFGFSSCCPMFGLQSHTSGYRTEIRQVKTCGYDTVTEQVRVGSAKDGMYETVEKKVPRYKTVTKKVRVSCGSCVRLYCPIDDCCGTTSNSTIRLSSLQGGSGSPHMGLVPTMKPIAP